jgi:preprotein translocase subunit SecA
MVLIMTILENWRNLAYGEGLDDKEKEELWTQYFKVEKGIYEHILSKPEEVVEGTVEELAKRYGTDVQTMTGFLDGINESLKGYENPVETMDENTVVKIEIDPEKLYYNMVEAKAEWLYSLPQWDQILTEEKKKELYKTQKASGTIVKGAKIGRNDPCPCGSGKKYKKCCGQNL